MPPAAREQRAHGGYSPTSADSVGSANRCSGGRDPRIGAWPTHSDRRFARNSHHPCLFIWLTLRRHSALPCRRYMPSAGATPQLACEFGGCCVSPTHHSTSRSATRSTTDSPGTVVPVLDETSTGIRSGRQELPRSLHVSSAPKRRRTSDLNPGAGTGLLPFGSI